MPHTFELCRNKVRLELYRFWNQSRYMLTSGLFDLKKVAPIWKGQRTFTSPAIFEQPLIGISIIVG
jgi:hypothetical protein